MKMKIESIAKHRNGISGAPFYVAIAECEDGRMLVVRFPQSSAQAAAGVLCAAFSMEQLAAGDIAMCSNSYRGDNFAAPMDKAIKKFEREA